MVLFVMLILFLAVFFLSNLICDLNNILLHSLFTMYILHSYLILKISLTVLD